MKRELPKEVLDAFIAEAKEGFGREHEIGGGNTCVEFTLLNDGNVPGELIGGTLKIYLNKHRKPIGHKLVAPKKAR